MIIIRVIFLAEKLIMVLGGYTSSGYTDDIEVISPNPTTAPVPSCLTELNPFPFSTIRNSAGGTTVPGESPNHRSMAILKSFLPSL